MFVQIIRDSQYSELNFESPKLDIESLKVQLKQGELSDLKNKQIVKLAESVAYNIFGRQEVIKVLGCGKSTASSLISEINKVGITTQVKGKGKYRFNNKA